MIDYNDVITIIEPGVDGYGNETVKNEAIVAAVWEQNTGYRHGSNQSAIDANATALVDPDNEFVQSKFDRLEGMLVIAPLFGASVGVSWYRITSVVVSRDTQLANEIDNIQLHLKKTAGIPGVS
jgi:hypothetical protein